MEQKTEIWFTEYQLQHSGRVGIFLTTIPHNSADEALAAFERVDFKDADPTLIGPVKFVREEVKPAPDADGWIPHKPGDPMPVANNVPVIVKFGDGRIPDERTAGFWGGKPHESCWEKDRLPSNEIHFYKLA